MKTKTPLPGLPTMAALMLAGTIAASLGLWGPFDVIKLKEWQTVMAAIIAPTLALIPATIAYKAATAKVHFDRQEADRRRGSDALGLWLRLQIAAAQLQTTARQIVNMLDIERSPTNPLTISVSDLALGSPATFNEAFQNLHLVPPSETTNIFVLHGLFPLVEERLALLADRRWTIDGPIRAPHDGVARPGDDDDFIWAHREMCRDICVWCEQILDAVSDRINQHNDRFK